MEITQIIEDYILSDKADGAILINGEWGVGKSYFLRHTLIPHLENIQLAPKGHYKCLYISLNGLSAKEEIINQIAFEKIPWAKRKGMKMFSSAGGMLLNVVSKIPLISQFVGDQSTDVLKGIDIQNYLSFKNNILCFDDLERLSGISAEEVLGFINVNFIEANKVKCIILGNENEIDTTTSYFRIKEKTISRTLNFDRANVSLSEIFERYKENKDFYRFLSERENYLNNLIANFEQNNWRTVIFAIDILKNIFTKSNVNLYGDKMLSENIVLFSFLISFEYKSGRLLSSQDKASGWLQHITPEGYNKALQTRIIKLQGQSPEGYQDLYRYEIDFVHRYGLAATPIFPMHSIYVYILSGYLDDKELQQDVKQAAKWKEHIESQKTKPEFVTLQYLSDFHWKNDENKLRQQIKSFTEFVAAGKFPFTEYPSLHNPMKKLMEAGIIEKGAYEDFIRSLVSGCKLAIRLTQKSFDVLQVRDNITKSPFEEINHLIEEHFQTLAQEDKNSTSNSFFNVLSGPYERYAESRYYHYNPFPWVSADTFFEKIRDGNFDLLRNLEAYLHDRSKNKNVLEWSVKEADQMNSIVEKLETLKESEMSKLRKYHLEKVIFNFSKLKDLISEFNKEQL